MTNDKIKDFTNRLVKCAESEKKHKDLENIELEIMDYVETIDDPNDQYDFYENLMNRFSTVCKSRSIDTSVYAKTTFSINQKETPIGGEIRKWIYDRRGEANRKIRRLERQRNNDGKSLQSSISTKQSCPPSDEPNHEPKKNTADSRQSEKTVNKVTELIQPESNQPEQTTQTNQVEPLFPMKDKPWESLIITFFANRYDEVAQFEMMDGNGSKLIDFSKIHATPQIFKVLNSYAVAWTNQSNDILTSDIAGTQAINKVVSRIRSKLQRLTGKTDDPFEKGDITNGWKAKFQLRFTYQDAPTKPGDALHKAISIKPEIEHKRSSEMYERTKDIEENEYEIDLNTDGLQ